MHPSVPVRSVAELIALAKSKPGQLNYGTLGIGSSSHPTPPCSRAWRASGHPGSLPRRRAGADRRDRRTRADAVHQRDADEPAVEGRAAQGARRRPRQATGPIPRPADHRRKRAAGLSGGLLVRRVRAQRNAARDRGQDQCRRAAGAPDPTFQEKFLKANFYEAILGTPKEFADYIAADRAKWSRIIKDANISAE